MLSKAFALALVASAAAQTQFSITSPGPSIWWVSNSLNTLAWSPCDTTTQASIPAFNVVVMNSNQQILAGNLTILGNQPTFDCSKTITPENIPVGTGYTMFLTQSTNTNLVLASTTFEMRAAGSTYPPPLSSSSPSATANGSATGGSASSTSTSSGKNAARALILNLQGLFGAVVGASAFMVSFF